MNTTLRLSATAALLLSAAATAFAGPTCTSEPESKWISEADMAKRLQALGYQDNVKKLHVSKGKCWEIYGTDKQGRKVEVYFHPITGAIAEENVKN
jgi:hypothetical protein